MLAAGAGLRIREQRRMLELLSWANLSAVLQRFKKLNKVHVKLHISNVERSFAFEYLELAVKGLAGLKVDGKAFFDWSYYHNAIEGESREFRLL